MRRIIVAATLVSGGLLAHPEIVRASSIHYQATDLPDAPGGGDLWQYEYFVSGRVFDVDEGFAVFFAPSLYSALATGPSSPAGWDAIVQQPVPVLASNGYYDALALTANPSLAGPFLVSFTWLGTGTPGAQPFEVYRLDGLVPVPFELGTTSAQDTATPVPEPSTLLLVSTGAVAARSLRRRRKPADASSV